MLLNRFKLVLRYSRNGWKMKRSVVEGVSLVHRQDQRRWKSPLSMHSPGCLTCKYLRHKILPTHQDYVCYSNEALSSESNMIPYCWSWGGRLVYTEGGGQVWAISTLAVGLTQTLPQAILSLLLLLTHNSVQEWNANNILEIWGINRSKHPGRSFTAYGSWAESNIWNANQVQNAEPGKALLWTIL